MNQNYIDLLYGTNTKVIETPNCRLYKFSRNIDKDDPTPSQLSSINLYIKSETLMITTEHRIFFSSENPHYKVNKHKNQLNKEFFSAGREKYCISFKKNKCILYYMPKASQRKNTKKFRIFNYKNNKQTLIFFIVNSCYALSGGSSPFFNNELIEKSINKQIRILIKNQIAKHGYSEEWKSFL